MGYRITLKKSVGRDLKRIDPQDATRILDQIEGELAVRPFDFPSLKGRFAGLRRMRVGQYRVIYTVIAETVLVTRISHRREVYR